MTDMTYDDTMRMPRSPRGVILALLCMILTASAMAQPEPRVVWNGERGADGVRNGALSVVEEGVFHGTWPKRSADGRLPQQNPVLVLKRGAGGQSIAPYEALQFGKIWADAPGKFIDIQLRSWESRKKSIATVGPLPTEPAPLTIPFADFVPVKNGAPQSIDHIVIAPPNRRKHREENNFSFQLDDVSFVMLPKDAPPEPEKPLEREAGIARMAILDARHLAIGTLREPGAVLVGDATIAERVTQRVLLGETEDEPWFSGYWTYVEFDEALTPGKRYEVDVDTDGTATLTFDPEVSVSACIKINQLGYLPGMPKLAYLGGEIPGMGPLEFDATHFDVVTTDTGCVVFHGEVHPAKSVLTNRRGEELSGELVAVLDFTSFDMSGDYAIRIDGVGKSMSFRIGNDAWAPLYFHTARFLYHQRNGMELTGPYTHFTRPSNGARPVYRGQQPPRILGFGKKSIGLGRDLNAWSIEHREEPPLIDAWSYGWRNAADEDDIASLHLSNVFDILWNYERAPDRFADHQLNLPESSNGVPDILDEALYFLEGYRRLQGAIGTGEVPGWINNSRQRFLEESSLPWVCAAPDRAATLAFAAAFGKMAVVLQGLEHPLALAYETAALDAYRWGADDVYDATETTLHAIANRGRGDDYDVPFTEAMAEQRNENVSPYLVMAKTAIFALTRDAKYLGGLDALLAKCPPPAKHPFTMKDYSLHFYGDLVGLPEYKDETRRLYLDTADRLVALLDQGDYQNSKALDDRALGFGNGKTMGQARFLLFCFELTKDAKYLRAAVPNVDFVLGANPLGLSWITYVGQAWPQHIQVGETTLYPGISVYGHWETFGKDAAGKRMIEHGKISPDRPLYKRWAQHPRFLTIGNEYELNDSTALFCGLYFLPSGWFPGDALRETKPISSAKNPGAFPLL